MEEIDNNSFDEQTEKVVLGAILQDNHVLVDIANIIDVNAFYLKKHRHIYQTMLEIFQQSGPIDEVILGDKLDQKGVLADCGSYLYLLELLETATASENAVNHSKILKERFLTRELIRISSETAINTKGSTQNINQLLEKTQSQLESISQQSVEKPYIAFDESLSKTITTLKKLSDKGSDLTGLATGFSFLDRITSGLQNSDLIVVAARPSMGKTAFSLNIAQYVAIKKKKPVIFFSLEMSDEQLCLRAISSEAEVDSHEFRTGKIGPDNWLHLSSKIKEMESAPLYICDKGGLSTFEFQVICKQIYRQLKGNLALIVVDYLQLMRSADKKQNRQEEIAEISSCLKNMAKELNIPVIANAQLNRDLEKRKGQDKKPILSDLRESGSIEQDADIILFIYRDAVYNPETQFPNVAEILVSKFRNGATGTHHLYFKGEHTKFTSLSAEDEAEIISSQKQGNDFII